MSPTGRPRGRPRTPPDPSGRELRKYTCHLYLFGRHYDLVRAEATRQGRSISNLARYALLRYLGIKDEADGLPARPESWIGSGNIDPNMHDENCPCTNCKPRSKEGA